MPLDAICINALSAELSQTVLGAKIDKVQQPARDTVILTVHGSGRTSRLLISVGSGTARAHLTNESFENPQAPPMFCMLLRKHLVGARITAINQPDFERMLQFELAAFDEMGSAVQLQLIAELMGRNSNLILVGQDGRIIDSLRRVDSDMSRSRQVLPGLFYQMPPKQEKPVFNNESVDIIQNLLTDTAESRAVDKLLQDSFSGLSPLICRELCFRSTGEVSKPVSLMTGREKAALLSEMRMLNVIVEKQEFRPTMLLQEERAADYSFLPIRQYESLMQLQQYENFSSLLDAFYSRRDKQEHMRRKSQGLLKLVKSAHERSQRKLAARRQELIKSAERDLNKKRGELITANLHRMKKGDRALITEDYYEPDCPQTEIALDPLKTPLENAAAYFREYNKAKTAEKYLGELIENGEKEEAYLASVVDIISRTENERELAEIQRELVETGFIRQQRSAKKEKIKESLPLSFISSSGFEILVGRNNSQNDKLTTKTAMRNDVWLHVQKIHGSHVVISCKDAVPDEQTLREAASLAVYYSQARESGKTPVDYTQIRYVKKPSGSMPGAVIYTDYKTIIAQPDESLAEKLLKS